MQTEITGKSPLNDVQIALLRLFSRDMTQAETLAVQKLLLDFYEKELDDEVERVIREKKIERKDFDKLLDQQQRTK